MDYKENFEQDQKLGGLFVEEAPIEKLPFLKRRRSFSLLLNVVFYFCGFILIVITGFSYIYILTDIEGKSMMPTINASGYNTDLAYINRLKKGERGDIIVFKKENSSKFVIKRLIATSGDKIFIGKIGNDSYPKIYLKINGSNQYQLLDEPYIADNDGMQTKTWPGFQNLQNNPELTFDGDGFLYIPEGYIFCLGDNRKVSDDSSSYGIIPSYEIVGRVDIIVHEGENPTIQAAKYVMQQFGLLSNN